MKVKNKIQAYGYHHKLSSIDNNTLWIICFFIWENLLASTAVVFNSSHGLTSLTHIKAYEATPLIQALHKTQLTFIFLILFIYLFLAVLGLRFCAKAFSSCGKRGPLFIAVRGPLTVAASLVAEHRLQTRGLSN